MMRGLLSGMLVLCGTSWALAEGPGEPPRQQVARIDAAGNLVMTLQVIRSVAETRVATRQVPVQEEFTVQVDGVTRKKVRTVLVPEQFTYTVLRNISESVSREQSLDFVKAFETSGKAIPVTRLKERLRRDTLVVVSGNQEMIPDDYASLFRPGTIVLAMQQPPMLPLPGAPPGAPVAPVAPAAPVAPPAPVVPAAPGGVRAVSPDASIQFVAQQREAGAAEEADALQIPAKMAPLFVFASRDVNDRYQLRQTTERSVAITGQRTVTEGNQKKIVPVPMQQTVRHSEITALPGAHLEFFAPEGTSVPPVRAAELLARETAVLYSADGERVDPFWLQNLKPTTLVLVGPQLPGGGGYATVNGEVGPPVAPDAIPAAPVAPAPAPKRTFDPDAPGTP